MKQTLTIFILILSLKGISQSLFTRLPSSETNVTFNNLLIESPEQNIITYEYFYNGGGVATADFNNDGLIDIYFTSNQQPNKLYLNKGNFKFQDITKQANAEGKKGWKTGVSVADVNGDGFLDIYLCYSGDVDREDRKNQLLINNGKLGFTDKAEEYGVADMGFTTHAAFFDYDRDGDLDLFVLNHNVKSLRNFDAAFVKRMIDDDAGDRLYKNENGKFVDVTSSANIISNPLGYGLGINVSDINNDGWPDIYVTNDYVEEDYLYINNQDGTFRESLKEQMGHLSNFSMGVDITDLNNDDFPEIFTLDMLPADNKRQKLLYAPDNFELYYNQVKNGFHHQLMRNMLQLNNGNGTFSEIGQSAGISNTDWSWAALFADFDNDGNKDLFVTNGYGRDMINRDFMKFYANERLKHERGQTDGRMFRMLQGIKSTPLQNFYFSNSGAMKFKDVSSQYGFEQLSFSHGAAYADLDNDGDLDLVVNNMNEEAGIFQNNTKNRNCVIVNLLMPGKNSFAYGAKVIAYSDGIKYSVENTPVHGFQSSMTGPLFIGLKGSKIDSLFIRWPDGKMQKHKQKVELNKVLNIQYDVSALIQLPASSYSKPIFSSVANKIPFTHKEDDVNDFKIQPLLPNMFSFAGPRMTKADLNKDGLEDLYICGARGQSGAIMIQMKSGDFVLSNQPEIEKDKEFEDADAIFFDAENDGDQDLFVASCGYDLADNDTLLNDRLYINENGVFKRHSVFPDLRSGSVVKVHDIDQDGDLDLFVGTRVNPSLYPENPISYFLINDGKANFTIKDLDVVKSLVCDALFLDINKDGNKELVLIGEWMSPQVISFKENKIELVTPEFFEGSFNGWWNRLHAADLDMDGDLDLVAANWGSNSQYVASESQPVELYYGDFDNNGYVDPLMCYYVGGKSYPVATRDEMTDQMVSLRQRFPTYDAYSEAGIKEILDEEQLKNAKKLTANILHTVWFENRNGKFIMHELPSEANYTSVHAIAVDDFNGDGKPDIFLVGNQDKMRIRTGKMDASYGVLLTGDGKGNFSYVKQLQSGLKIKGCVRDVVLIKNGKQQFLLASRNDQQPVILKYSSGEK